MITHDMVGADEDLARELLIVARSIAPCIDSFEDHSEQRKDALAILKRVYKEIDTLAAQRGSRFVKGQTVGPSRVEYFEIESAFNGTPRAALRALCASSAGGLPRGSFPAERPVSRLWPESYS